MRPVVLPRPAPLVPGTLVLRYKRFLADVRLDTGQTVVAHCVNTGAMEGLTRPGTRVWLSRSNNPARKLAFTWELAEIRGQVIGVNTALPNRVVGELLRGGHLPWLGRWDELRAEKPYGERSRVDFWMRRGEREHYLEVKNCHLAYPDRRAYFPDTVSERASAHLRELSAVIGPSISAGVLFFIQVPGVKSLRPSDVHDPAFAGAARVARRAGVRFSAITVTHEPGAIVVTGRVPVDLNEYGTGRMIAWREENRAVRQTPL
jgi:sugar fermentation stimulation protein A